MTLQSLSRLPTVLSLVAVGTVGAALAQPAFEPRVGQDGKDVVWVPTAQTLVDKMLDMAKVTPSDYVIDLGSGDGRTVITAAKRGAKAHGIEYNADMVKHANENAQKAGVAGTGAGKAVIRHGDIFATDFTFADEGLRAFYGDLSPDENDPDRALLPEARRGILGHASFIAANSGPDLPSPTTRGS